MNIFQSLSPFVFLALFRAASAQEDPPNLLIVNVAADGTVKVQGRVYFKPNPLKPMEQDTKKLADLFEARRAAAKGSYPILIRAGRSTPYQYVQLVMMTAAAHGGVTQIQFGTLRDDETEGKLLSQLPKDKGLSPSAEVEIQEVRIVLCVADGDEKERERHLTDKGRHEANLELEEQADLGRTAEEKPAHLILNDVCVASVDKNAIGPLYKSWVCKEEKHREETKLDAQRRQAENKERYKAIAAQAKKQYDLIPADKEAPVILDADSAVPYEHIVGIVDACKEAGIENVEFVSNPRWAEKGEFDHYREKK